MFNQELETLLERIADGDKSAFELLYDRTNKLLFSLLMRMLGDRQIAEEVLTNAYINLWKQAPLYEPKDATAFAWIISITRSFAIERLPSESISQQSESLPELLRLEIAESVDTDVDFISEGYKLVSSVIKKLPPEQSQIIGLAYFSCLNQREIADRLELPVETVNFHLQMGMNKLREQIKFSKDR